jgi:hypothetical protein
MRLIGLAVVLVLSLAPSLVARAQPRWGGTPTGEPPKGYRNIKWGSSPSGDLKKYSPAPLMG